MSVAIRRAPYGASGGAEGLDMASNEVRREGAEDHDIVREMFYPAGSARCPVCRETQPTYERDGEGLVTRHTEFDADFVCRGSNRRAG